MMKEILIKTLFDPDMGVSLSSAKRLLATGGGKTSGGIFDKAMKLSKKAHESMYDKAGTSYFLHPEKVASLLFTHEHIDVATDEALAVAFLHDVVEDTEITLEDLALIFPKDVVDGVDGMTRRGGESFNDYFRRFSVEPIAKVVKKYDIIHNMDLTRLGTITVEDVTRTERYARTLKKLMKVS